MKERCPPEDSKSSKFLVTIGAVVQFSASITEVQLSQSKVKKCIVCSKMCHPVSEKFLLRQQLMMIPGQM